MKILVGVKRVIDAYAKVRVKGDNTGVETHNVKMSMNPFDEIALEEAIRLKEAGLVTEVCVVSIDGDAAKETLYKALALGADRAILVKTDRELRPLSVAKVLQKIVEQEAPDLVILGKQSIDGDNNQTGQMLAGLLDWPQGTFVSKLEIAERTATVTREIDGGLQTLRLQLPAVITTDLRLNEPRYASLPNIMKAKKKPLATVELESLELTLERHVEILAVNPPPERTAGVKVATVQELVEKLKNEAGVI